MLTIAKQKCLDAVLFTSDQPALKFKKILKESKLKTLPLVTGFDDWIDRKGADTEHLTTVRVDFEGLGVAAVNVMLENKLEDWGWPEIVRVPCKLIARD